MNNASRLQPLISYAQMLTITSYELLAIATYTIDIVTKAASRLLLTY